MCGYVNFDRMFLEREHFFFCWCSLHVGGWILHFDEV